MSKNTRKYEQLNIFEFGNDEEGKYVNFSEEEQKKLLEQEKIKYPDYSYEEITKDFTFSQEYEKLLAYNFLDIFSQYKKTIPELVKEIKTLANNICWHYVNFDKKIYVYSFEHHDEENNIDLYIQIDKYYIHCCEHKLQEVLKDGICFPACMITIYENVDGFFKKVDGPYGEKEKDIRYQIICDKLQALNFGTNRIDPDKKPKDFYEVKFELIDFMNYWGSGGIVTDGKEN